LELQALPMDIARLHEMTDRLQDARDKLVQEKLYLEPVRFRRSSGLKENYWPESRATPEGIEERADSGPALTLRSCYWGRPVPGRNWWRVRCTR